MTAPEDALGEVVALADKWRQMAVALDRGAEDFHAQGYDGTGSAWNACAKVYRDCADELQAALASAGRGE